VPLLSEPKSSDQPVSNTRFFAAPMPRVVPPTATAYGSESVTVRPGVSPEAKYMPTPSAAARTSMACTIRGDTDPSGICHEFDAMEAKGWWPSPVSTAEAAFRNAWSSSQPSPTTITWFALGAMA
jgi:hypothetical protein